jgi:hypothetical protein
LARSSLSLQRTVKSHESSRSDCSMTVECKLQGGRDTVVSVSPDTYSAPRVGTLLSDVRVGPYIVTACIHRISLTRMTQSIHSRGPEHTRPTLCHAHDRVSSSLQLTFYCHRTAVSFVKSPWRVLWRAGSEPRYTISEWRPVEARGSQIATRRTQLARPGTRQHVLLARWQRHTA